MKLPNLAVLYCNGNEFTKKISHYRKVVISKIPTLKYLDDRPVFEEDRRRAEAFTRGGIEEERAEIRRIKKEKDDKHWANHEAFMAMI
jgi:dynein assembly factor 1